jgi:hypothetical protein
VRQAIALLLLPWVALCPACIVASGGSLVWSLNTLPVSLLAGIMLWTIGLKKGRLK